MHLIAGTILIVILVWGLESFLKALSKDLKNNAAYRQEEYDRRIQMENLEYQLKMEQLEALRRQNRNPPRRPPLEPV